MLLTTGTGSNYAWFSPRRSFSLLKCIGYWDGSELCLSAHFC